MGSDGKTFSLDFVILDAMKSQRDLQSIYEIIIHNRCGDRRVCYSVEHSFW